MRSKKHNKKIVKKFLQKMLGDKVLVDELLATSKDNLFNGKVNKKFYALLETFNYNYEVRGCFMGKKQLKQLIIENSCINAGPKDKYTTWDKITVLDIEKNKIVKPKKISWS